MLYFYHIFSKLLVVLSTLAICLQLKLQNHPIMVIMVIMN